MPFSIFQTVAMVIGVVSLVERYGRAGRDDWQPFRSQRVLARISPAKTVTLNPDETIRCTVPVTLKADARGFKAGVFSPTTIAINSAASGWGSDCDMMVDNVTRR